MLWSPSMEIIKNLTGHGPEQPALSGPDLSRGLESMVCIKKAVLLEFSLKQANRNGQGPFVVNGTFTIFIEADLKCN